MLSGRLETFYAGSKFTSQAEANYSPTEDEALAVAYALDHSKIFTLGCHKLIVSVDHQPLLGILNDRGLSSISNRRLQNLKESTFPWRFKVFYNLRKWHRGRSWICHATLHAVLFIISLE